MRQRNLAEMMDILYASPGMTYKDRIRHGIAPNQMVFIDDLCGVLVCKQSNDGEHYSISQAGLAWCIQQEDIKPGIQIYVLLVNRQGAFINQTTVRNLKRILNGFPPRKSDNPEFGPYWWVDKDFSPKMHKQTVSQPPWSVQP